MSAQKTRLAQYLPYLLAVTADAVSDRIAEEYRARFGIRIPEWRVLVVLGDAGAQTQRDLVRATHLDKVAVNRACRALEERGLASRQANTRDGRSHHVGLTETGRAVHERIMPLALQMEHSILGVLSKDERQVLQRLLARIREGAGQSDADLAA